MPKTKRLKMFAKLATVRDMAALYAENPISMARSGINQCWESCDKILAAVDTKIHDKHPVAKEMETKFV